jgi:hypothetical protein
MVGKITTVPKSKIATPVGRLDNADTPRLNQATLVFLGLAASSRAQRATWGAPQTTISIRECANSDGLDLELTRHALDQMEDRDRSRESPQKAARDLYEPLSSQMASTVPSS